MSLGTTFICSTQFLVLIYCIFCLFAFLLLNKKLRKRGLVVSFFYSFTLVFLLLTLPIVFSEIINPDKSNDYKEIFTAGASFSGTVLAIVFTLLAFPLESYLGKISRFWLSKIMEEFFIRFSFAFFAFVFVYNIVFLVIGATKLLAWSSVFLSCYSLLVLFILLRQIFKYLDPTFLIKARSDEIKSEIPEIFQRKLKTILASYSNGMPKKSTEKAGLILKAQDLVVSELESKIDPILQVANQAIKDNQIEVVVSGLQSVQEITIEYLESKEASLQPSDDFLMFLSGQLSDMTKRVGLTSHYRIMPSILQVCRNIAVKSTEIPTIFSKTMGQNDLPLGFINIIADVSLSREILKDNSYAPTLACDYLTQIGYALLDKGYLITFDSILSKLSNISVRATKLHFLFADYVAQRANTGIVALLDFALGPERLKKQHPLYLKHFIEHIETITKSYLEDDYRYLLRDNISPFYSGVSQVTISRILVSRLSQIRDDKEYLLLLDFIKELVSRLNQLIMFGTDQKRFLEVKDMVREIYTIAIELAKSLWEGCSNERRRKITTLFKNRFYYCFYNPVYSAFTEEDVKFEHDFLYLLLSFIGICILVDNGDLEDLIYQAFEGMEKFEKILLSKLFENYKGEKIEIPGVSNALSDVYHFLIVLLSFMLSLKDFPLIRQSIIDILFKEIDERLVYEKYFSIGHFQSRDYFWPFCVSMRSIRGEWVLADPDIAIGNFYPEADFLLKRNDAERQELREYLLRFLVQKKLIQFFQFRLGKRRSYMPLETWRYT